MKTTVMERVVFSLRVDPQVLAALKKLKAEHGSYNKGLREVLLKQVNAGRRNGK